MASATVIPFEPSNGRYRFTTTIGTEQYGFKVRWNSREGAWYFDMLEFDDTPILEGVKVVLGANMGRWSNHKLFQDGALFARSFSRPRTEPGFDDLGARVQVFYLDRADLVSQLLAFYAPAV